MRAPQLNARKSANVPCLTGFDCTGSTDSDAAALEVSCAAVDAHFGAFLACLARDGWNTDVLFLESETVRVQIDNGDGDGDAVARQDEHK